MLFSAIDLSGQRISVDAEEISYNPSYRVTKCGRVFSDGGMKKRKCGWKELKQTILKASNRPVVSIHLSSQQKLMRVCRLVLETYKGLPPEGMECCHLDGNPQNNHIDNLYWGTPKQNTDDRERHGKTIKGENSHFTDLTNEQAEELIRDIEKYKGVHGYRITLAKKHNVSIRMIKHIVHGDSWGWLKEKILSSS